MNAEDFVVEIERILKPNDDKEFHAGLELEASFCLLSRLVPRFRNDLECLAEDLSRFHNDLDNT
jgi:hypothetical protein